jgi:hypothetical protein
MVCGALDHAWSSYYCEAQEADEMEFKGAIEAMATV